MTQTNPIIAEIERIAADRLSGILSLALETSAVQVHFQDGLISAAATDVPRYKLGRFLSMSGYIQESAVGRLVEESRKKKQRIGEFAVRKNLLGDEDLSEILREQVVNILMHALSAGFEVSSFEETTIPIYLPARISPQQLLLEIARRSLHPFTPEPNQLIVLNNGHNLSNLDWYPQELSVIGKLQFPRSLQELAVSTGLEYGRLGKILSVLHHLEMITTIDETPAGTTALATRSRISFENLVPEIDKSAINNKLEVYHNYLSFIGEQFKTLKVRIQELAASGPPPQAITISSPHEQDGKSLISTNLALCFAKDPGKRVILIDCDLRKPSVHKYLGTSIEPGLYGYLSEDYMQPYCYMRRIDRLYVMTAGGVAENPVELLSLDKMRQLIDFLKRDFDTIIIDTPPLSPVSDAQILTKLSDGLILVIRSARTSYANLERAFRSVDRTKLLGMILNDVQPRAFHTHYDYHYYSHYSYGPGKPKSHHRTYFE